MHTIISKKNTDKCNLASKKPIYESLEMHKVAVIILGGGQGTRLFPLTTTCCKPALCFGGVFKLIDIPISNAINSHCHKVYVITQFLSSSLHKHICKTYNSSGAFNNNSIDLLTAEQRPTAHHPWFQGTADAVRQNLYYLSETPADYFLILSGDQIYRMDFQEIVAFAKQTNAEAVIATLPVNQEDAKRMGIMKIDEKQTIVTFKEKPQQAEELEELKSAPSAFEKFGCVPDQNRPYLGSMGIYLFKRQTLIDLLLNDERDDFGKHLLPALIAKSDVKAFIYDGYWEDIGTVSSFYNANIALTQSSPPFNLYDEHLPIFKRPSKLPGAKIYDTQIINSIICEGSIIEADEINNSILGPRTIVKKGTVIRNSYIMGNDFYSPPIPHERFPEHLQIGEQCFIDTAIIDNDVCIGNRVRLINKNKLDHYDSDKACIRDGIIIIPRGASLPDDFVL